MSGNGLRIAKQSCGVMPQPMLQLALMVIARNVPIEAVLGLITHLNIYKYLTDINI